MYTAGVARVGEGQGKSLLLPAPLGEEQGSVIEGLFAKNMGELIAGYIGAKTPLANADKKDLSGAKDLNEQGQQISGAEEILARDANVPTAFACEGPHATQLTEGLEQVAKEASTVKSSDIEQSISSKTLAEGVNKADSSTIVAGTQNSSGLRFPMAGMAIPQAVAHIVLSKEMEDREKLQAAREHKAETKRETKREVNEQTLNGDAAAVSSDAIAVQPPATAIAVVSPMNVGVLAAPKIKAVASAKSSPGANLTAGNVVGNGRDRVQRGDAMVVSGGLVGTPGAYSNAGHLQNIGTADSKRDASPTAREGEIATKLEDTNAVTGVLPVVPTTGVHVGGHSLTIADGNKSGLPIDTESTVVARSQELLGDVAPVNEGHRMLSATPTSLEVGVANGSHGWLKIRAELADGGTVNASVSSASSAGQEMLHRELPSLTAYLQSERLGVSTVVVHATASTTERDFAGAMSSGDQGGLTRHGGEGERGGDAHEGLIAAGSDHANEVGTFGAEEVDAATLSSAVYEEGGSGGGWLSVMA
jgi:hypothetical protein